MYQFEKSKLYSYLGQDLVETLKSYKTYIAGGTITSLFCNREINDIDIYFRDQESLIDFIYDIWGSDKWVVSHTKKATLIKYQDKEIQLIHFNYFKSAENIFDTFDFSVCMGCFDFETEQFILHNDFLKHNSQRLLKFNSKTAYPIVSALRVQKYQDKGYTISKPEYIRILLTCMNLHIENYSQLKEQMGGMYGINYDKLFNDDKEFSLEKAIDKISNLSHNEDYFKKPEQILFDDVDDIVDSITNKEIRYIKVNNKHYRIRSNNTLKPIYIDPFDDLNIDDNDIIDYKEFLQNKKLYKFVNKVDDRYYSFYKDTFEYKIGEIAKAENNYLYCGELSEVANLTYSDQGTAKLLELEINAEDFDSKHGDAIRIKKCKVLREVPKVEYERFL